MINFLFDIDGTLTRPMNKMGSDFSWGFISWMDNQIGRGNMIWLVTGSDFDKVFSQVPASVIQRCGGIFCSMGNQLIIENKQVYGNAFVSPFGLRDFLNEKVESSAFHTKTGNHIEERIGMLNFSVVGRNASKEERKIYSDWDKENKERETIAVEIKSKFKDMEAVLGGEISIDIQPQGRDKSQATDWVRKNIGGTMVFFGDKLEKGGNDYSIFLDLLKNGDGLCFNVSGPAETNELLTGDLRIL